MNQPNSPEAPQPEPSADSPASPPNAGGDKAAANNSDAGSTVDSPSQQGTSQQGTDRESTPREKFEAGIQKQRDSLDDHEPEESLWSGGYSPKAMVGSWIGMVFLTVAIFFAVAFTELTLSMAAILIVVLWLLVAANYARKRLGFHYQLTSQRFIHKTGLLTRRTDRIEVIDIDDVSYEQGPVQRLFGVGTITITSSDRSDPLLSLFGISKVSEVAGLIDDIRRAERRRRSLHIESI